VQDQSPPALDEAEWLQSAFSAIAATQDLSALEGLRVRFLGKKGELTERLKQLGALPPEQRKQAGAELNRLKESVAASLQERQEALAGAALANKLHTEALDVSLMPRPQADGRIHPISKTVEEFIAIFSAQGFAVASGPDIESDELNFGKMNFTPDHPARQMQDSFYLPAVDGETMILRTHTSPVQARVMLSQKPPIRIIAPGRTFRVDYDQTHTPMFHQIEGLVLDTSATMAELKGCLLNALRVYFGIPDLPLRFRPSYFPFVEPGAEIDIGCKREGGTLKLGNYQDWLEIGGCGMVHPQVLSNCGLDPERIQGFAFGMGIERMAMLKYGIPDLRTFFESDQRWLKHYGFLPFAAA
jgi:phenylalanyl-tRNA synthetase alpha chain